MELKVTERDKKILVVLLIFVLVLGVGVGIGLPLLNKGNDLMIAAAEAKSLKTENQDKITNLPAMEKTLQDLNGNTSQMQKNFYPMMKSMQVDQMLTETALAQGINIKTLDITMPQTGEYTKLMGYADILNQSSAATSATADAAATDGITYNGIYTVKASLTMSGGRTALQAVLNAYTALEPKLRVDSFIWQTTSGSSEYSLGISVEIYMYEDTNQYIAEQQQLAADQAATDEAETDATLE